MSARKIINFISYLILLVLIGVLQDSRSITAACQHYQCAGIEAAGMTQPLAYATDLDAAGTTQQAIAKSILYGDRGFAQAKKPTEMNICK
ncbi:hypothetical protein [Lutispora sp.]|uniref:hypothetical protein n=1 Tax=Lutispora sp. TaxID=2828727 RepID=UPI003567539F